jgi:hypothetical protein
MASKPQEAYRVIHSGGTYGEATPYAVVSVASGMPHLPAHASSEAAQQVADRLNVEARREEERSKKAAQRKAARLKEEASVRDDGLEGDLNVGDAAIRQGAAPGRASRHRAGGA